jgi:hypothetical protein
MTICKSEYEAMQQAQRNGDEDEYREACREFEKCLRKAESILAGRDSHSASWDEKLYLFNKQLQEMWKNMFEGLNLPPRPTCGKSSLQVRKEIFGNEKNAMVFSKKIQEAFVESGVKLQDGETFACLVCVVNKPEYVSEAVNLDPLYQRIEGAPRLNYIMEPAVMQSTMNSIKQDLINYDLIGK